MYVERTLLEPYLCFRFTLGADQYSQLTAPHQMIFSIESALSVLSVQESNYLRNITCGDEKTTSLVILSVAMFLSHIHNLRHNIMMYFIDS